MKTNKTDQISIGNRHAYTSQKTKYSTTTKKGITMAYTIEVGKTRATGNTIDLQNIKYSSSLSWKFVSETHTTRR